MAAVKGKESEHRQSYWDNYWSEHSSHHTIEGMMFDTKAALLDKEDRPEVLSILPSYEGKSVLELGAGIGRFTADFAKTAGELVTVDLIASLIQKNEAINGHYKNVKFVCADVASPDFDFPAESFDLIFSSWLLLYLTDEEVKDLAQRMLRWLKVGGHIFFRESCFRHSGDLERKNNPSYYREPEFYNKVFRDSHLLDDSGNSFEFSLVNYKCVGTYVRIRKDHNQICWMWKKIRSGDDRGFLKYFDKCSKILQHELAFGEGFVSTGGIDVTKEFVAKLDLQPGQNVLDVGCGTGGADFYMAEKYDVRVVCLDLSIDMISLALGRALGRQCVVEFEVADYIKKDYPQSTFDVIYSRETILHIQDKPSLIRSFYKWLKPGGRVLITCYCKRAAGSSSPEDFANYILQEGYDLQDMETYEQMLKDAGFEDVIVEDRTEQFVNNLEKELENVEKNKESFIKNFSEEDYKELVGELKSKVKWGGSGELRYGLFLAKKN